MSAQLETTESTWPHLAAINAQAETAGSQNQAKTHIDRLLTEIKSVSVRNLSQKVFQDLLRLLECLDLIEKHLRHVNHANETVTLFQLIHDDARSLIEFISREAVGVEEIPEDLSETFDGIAFALSHDLRRVFESDINKVVPQEAANRVIGRMIRSHEVLRNCLQQSTIALAIMFDENLAGSTLFDNSERRLRETMILRSSLKELMGLAAATETNPTAAAHEGLMDAVLAFRDRSLQLLMYTDWFQFEAFCERISATVHGSEEFSLLAHEFHCYIETLYGQVSMRSVLADGPASSLLEADLISESVLPLNPDLNPDISEIDNILNEFAMQFDTEEFALAM